METADLSDIDLIIRVRRRGKSKSEEQIDKLAKNGYKFRIAMRCESPQSVISAVRHGVGLGLLYYGTIKREIDQGEFSVVKLPGVELIRESYIVYSKEKPLSPVAQEFVSFLHASVAKNPPKTVISRVLDGRTNGQPRDYMLRSKLLSLIISIAAVDSIASVLA